MCLVHFWLRLHKFCELIFQQLTSAERRSFGGDRKSLQWLNVSLQKVLQMTLDCRNLGQVRCGDRGIGSLVAIKAIKALAEHLS